MKANKLVDQLLETSHTNGPSDITERQVVDMATSWWNQHGPFELNEILGEVLGYLPAGLADRRLAKVALEKAGFLSAVVGQTRTLTIWFRRP